MHIHVALMLVLDHPLKCVFSSLPAFLDSWVPISLNPLPRTRTSVKSHPLLKLVFLRTSVRMGKNHQVPGYVVQHLRTSSIHPLSVWNCSCQSKYCQSELLVHLGPRLVACIQGYRRSILPRRL